ncbi:MAG: nucleotidyltransferase domain-containing protein [Planctomycetia bacterium]
MRLSQADRDLIKATIAGRLGTKARVILFGSRTDESRRGGDIDVFVELSEPVESRLTVDCAVAAELDRAFDGRRVDVLVAAPNLPERPIDAIARRTGVAI